MAIRSRLNLDIGNELNAHAMKLIHYFAEDTTEKILNNIDRLDIHDTGALRNSIRSMVHYNAGGNSALVTFYYAHYGTFVEMAVGRYYGVDSDLRDGEGVKKNNIEIPPIDTVGYGPLKASFHDLPYKGAERHDTQRERTHRPRPFLMNEIRNGLNRISWRLLEELGNTVSIHMLRTIEECFAPDNKDGLWYKTGYTEKTRDYIPNTYPGGRGVISTV